jgi:hypothetical protein
MDRRYSVYDRRTDQPIVIHGTAHHCAAVLGVRLKTFYVYISRARKGRPGAPQKYEIFTDDEDEDDVDGEE